MKKLMFAAAAMLAGVAVADVTSANIVGYMGADIAGGVGQFTMINVPFNHVSNDGKGISLEELVIPDKYMDPDWDFSKCDQLWFWDPEKDDGIGGYWTYYWDVGNEDPNPDECWDAGWINTLTYEYFKNEFPNGLPEGAPFYFVNAQAVDKAVTFSGQVESRAEVEIPMATGNFTMVGNPYPVATDLEAVDFAGKYMDPDWDFSKCDQIWIWDPEKDDGIGGYWTYYWDIGNEDPNPDECWDAGWINTLTYEYFKTEFPDGIQAARPFYYNAYSLGGTKSATFTSPLTKK